MAQQHLCTPDQLVGAQIEAREYKNFNLLVKLIGGQSLLVKQERVTSVSKNRQDLWHEWHICQFFQSLPDLDSLQSLTSDAILYDSDRAILVVRYFDQYRDLGHFYEDRQHQVFPTAIAAVLGKTLAEIHCTTFDTELYKDFLTRTSYTSTQNRVRVPRFLRGLERIGPGLFSDTSIDAIDFWRLYQRYESLHSAMTDIYQKFDPCCLTHNDLNLWNILVHNNWDAHSQGNLSEPMVRLIDWEFFAWGDPAYDLGMLLSGYLKIWLKSLVLSRAVPITTALKLATTPLELLQPSMGALLKTYIEFFPAILERHPNFLIRVVQFAGLVLIKKLQGKIEHLSHFDNTCICTLQVAKTLVCSPEKSILSVFGAEATDIVPRASALV
ncbi:MAG: aminoglycoside phosphotransferase family protein [Thermosynechococcaceae cyanobacterium]